MLESPFVRIEYRSNPNHSCKQKSLGWKQIYWAWHHTPDRDPPTSLVICLVHQIRQPILRLRILNFWESFSQSDWRKKTIENSDWCFRNWLMDPVNRIIVIVWCWLLLPNCVLFHAAPVVSFAIISIEGEFAVLELCIPIQNSYLFVFTLFNYYCYFRLRLLLIHGAETLKPF